MFKLFWKFCSFFEHFEGYLPVQYSVFYLKNLKCAIFIHILGVVWKITNYDNRLSVCFFAISFKTSMVIFDYFDIILFVLHTYVYTNVCIYM